MKTLFRELFQAAAAIIAIPLAMILGLLRRLLIGDGCIVQVKVGPISGLESVTQWHRALGALADDDAVRAVVLRVKGPPGGWATIQQTREVLRDLSRAGIKTWAVLEQATEPAMYLASACDQVIMVPEADLFLEGVGTDMMFFGELLERLGVEADLEAAGAYKSFGEPFRRSFASPFNRDATTELVHDLHSQLVRGIALGRGLDEADVERLVGQSPISASEAKQAGLVDELAYEDTWREALEQRHHTKTWASFAALARLYRWGNSLAGWTASRATITVVHLEGPVVLEPPNRGAAVHADSVIPVLRSLRKDEDTAAVVLHVSSPGGSALASDLIWREVKLLSERCPVVAVYGDVSASGGFYLSAAATEIIAQPATITGSIGVFGGKIVLGDALSQWGVFTEPVRGRPGPALLSMTSPFTERQRQRFRESMQRIYDGFVERVAEGRGCDVHEIEPVCRGRVWSGHAAQSRKLVDHLGGLDLGIVRATELAGIARPCTKFVTVRHRGGHWIFRWVRQQVLGWPGIPVYVHRAAFEAVALLGAHTGRPMTWLPAWPGQSFGRAD